MIGGWSPIPVPPETMRQSTIIVMYSLPLWTYNQPPQFSQADTNLHTNVDDGWNIVHRMLDGANWMIYHLIYN
jgi:hypothetical protein